MVPSVLFVSKPVVPPWTDSNKNLVRDVSRALTGYSAHVLVDRPDPGAPPGLVQERVYLDAGGFAPSRLANARVLGRLLTGPRADVWHFFFAPNPLTLAAGRLAARVRRPRTVHTIASAPDGLEQVAPRLFADRVVVLSEHTRARLARIGVDSEWIPPALTVPTLTPDDLARARAQHGLPRSYVVFAGDLEFGNGAATFIETAAMHRDAPVDWVLAVRPKTPSAAQARERLVDLAAKRGANVRWLGEIPDIHAVVGGAAALVLVTDTLHAKMDWPLVVLEALAFGVPAVLSNAGPAAEIGVSGNAVCVPHGDAAALGEAVVGLLDRSPGARAAAGAAGAEWVRRTCSPQVVAAAHARLYSALLRG